ncbi:MAG: enoyl-CoA hydratase/isomerase family protein, partial [Pseudomonas sp.]|nr:enoyl-CoA hydratase/isomerase family protein [Pseudomonas sp.]
IEKDQTPHWHWPDIATIPEAVIEAHFAPAWDGEHPLADL